MKQFSILRNGQVAHSARFASEELGNAWVSQHEAMESFGKPAHVRIDRVVIQEAVFEDREQMIQAAVFDENDQEIEPAIYETVRECIEPEVIDLQEVNVPAEYELEIADISDQLAQEQVNNSARSYLASTDWYVIRFLETGIAVPAEVTSQRAAARASVND
jgi:hypothetical protein